MSARSEYLTPARFEAKLAAIPFPDLTGKRVLDIGCDHGDWCEFAMKNGAQEVTGIDRGRDIRNRGYVDLIEENKRAFSGRPGVEFIKADIGRQYPSLPACDLAFMFSVYHHCYEAAGGDHAPIWYWLWLAMRKEMILADWKSGVVLWEGPVDCSDPVVKLNVSHAYHERYTRDEILKAASLYFDVEHIGPALHEPTREVWRLTAQEDCEYMPFTGYAAAGAGGATKAFKMNGGARMAEINKVLGVNVVPGTLNVNLTEPFPWHDRYFRAKINDVVDRSKGFESAWAPRWCRFYPVAVNDISAYVMRFEGERYPANFVEIISEVNLREKRLDPCLRLYRHFALATPRNIAAPLPT